MNCILKTFLLIHLALACISISVQASGLTIVDYSQVSANDFLKYGASMIKYQGEKEKVFNVINDPTNSSSNIKVGKFDNYHVEDQTESGVTYNSWGILSLLQFSDSATPYLEYLFKDDYAIIDVSNYQQLEFSFYCEDADSDRSIGILLQFFGESTSNTTPPIYEWTLIPSMQPLLKSSSGGWLSVAIPLNKAFFAKSSSDAVFDLTRLRGVGALILNNSSAVPAGNNPLKPVYLKNIEITNGDVSSPYLSIDKTTVGFGNLSATASNFRFSSEIVNLDYFVPGYSMNWELRAYTSNPADTLGLIQVDVNNNPILNANGVPVSNIPLKINPGAMAEDGDEDDDANWYGDSASFSYVGNYPGYARIAFPFTDQGEANNPNADIFPVKFAIDIAGAAAGNYASEVTFELYIP